MASVHFVPSPHCHSLGVCLISHQWVVSKSNGPFMSSSLVLTQQTPLAFPSASQATSACARRLSSVDRSCQPPGSILDLPKQLSALDVDF